MTHRPTGPKERSNFRTKVQIQDHSVVVHLMPYRDQLLDYLYNTKTLFTFPCLLSSSLTQGSAIWLTKEREKKDSLSSSAGKKY